MTGNPIVNKMKTNPMNVRRIQLKNAMIRISNVIIIDVFLVVGDVIMMTIVEIIPMNLIA